MSFLYSPVSPRSWLLCWMVWVLGCDGQWDFAESEKECPDLVWPSLFYSSDRVRWGAADRALLTLPAGLRVRRSLLPGAGLGVFSRTLLPAYTWLGEYQGEYIPLNHTGEHWEYSWRVHRRGRLVYFVDATNIRMSNWLRFINTPNHYRDENVDVAMCYGRVYYYTKKHILPGQELLVYYGPSYLETNLNITPDEYYYGGS